MANYSTSARRMPVEENPRNPYREGAMNMAKILRDALVDFDENTFGRPWANQVYDFRLRELPPNLPVIDMKLIRCKPNKRNSGTQGVHMTYDTTYEVRYLYAISDSTIDEKVVENNLWRVHNELEYNSDVHGLCPNLRSNILEVDGTERFYPEFGDWVLGGIITIELPQTLTRDFWDGTDRPRELRFPTGSSH